MALRTDYKDDIYQGNRKYLQVKNEDGTVSFSDATQYEQEGDYFGANEINIISQAVNEAQDKADQAFQSASDGKTAIATAITGVDPGVVIPPDPTFAQLANCIEEIETDPYADIETKTGKSVQFTDADDALIAITAMGGTGSVDVVAMNNNVINPNRTPVTQSGITATMQEDKSYILNGTATAAGGVFILGSTYSGSIVFTLRKGTYVLRGTGTSLLGIYLYKADGTTINTSSNNLTFTLSADTDFSSISVRWFTASTVLNNVRVYPQVSFGSTLTAYEPHKENTLTIHDVTTAIYPLYLTSYKGITNVFTLSTGQPTFTAVAKSELWSGRKKVIPEAIQKADNSVTIPTNATFQQLADAIGQIETGVDTSDATVTAGDIIAPKTAYGPEGKIIGTMVNNGAINQALAVNGTYTIPKGYHNGSGKVTQSIAIKAAQTYTPGTANQTIAAQQYLSGVQTILGDPALVASNILNTANIFGVQGAAIAGKRFVSGTVFSGQAQYAFYSRAGGGNSWYGLTVSGLTFKPSIIVCMFRDTRNDGTSYAGDSYTIYSPITGYVLMFTAYDNSGQTSVTSYQVNVGDCYVNASGFRLPALPNVTYNWMAWE